MACMRPVMNYIWYILATVLPISLKWVEAHIHLIVLWNFCAHIPGEFPMEQYFLFALNCVILLPIYLVYIINAKYRSAKWALLHVFYTIMVVILNSWYSKRYGYPIHVTDINKKCIAVALKLSLAVFAFNFLGFLICGSKEKSIEKKSLQHEETLSPARAEAVRLAIKRASAVLKKSLKNIALQN